MKRRTGNEKRFGHEGPDPSRVERNLLGGSSCSQDENWVEWNGNLPSQPKQIMKRLLMEEGQAIWSNKWLKIELSGK